MKLVRLIYVSTKCDGVSADAIQDILRVAKEQNSKEGITGLLCFNRKYFVQVLEGERGQISTMYNLITADKRHKQVVLVSYEEIAERMFSRWSMGFVPESSLTSAAILKYSTSSEFRPYEMSGESLLRMMLSLKEVLSVS